jgi:hypothetical protein
VFFGVAVAALALAMPVFGPPSPVATVPYDGYVGEFGLADVTGDGIPDVVAVHNNDVDPTASQPLTILAGNRKGGFSDVTTQVFTGPVPRAQHPRQIVFADFNRDGRTDIFVADHGYDHPPFPGYQNTLVLSAPGGKLVDATANLPQQYDFSHSAAAGDVNGDGAPDLYVGNLVSDTSPPPAILVNDGTGHFHRLADALPSWMTGGWPLRRFTRETFADVNGDGRLDLVLLSEGNHAGIDWGPSTVLLNDGTGHFGELPNALPPKPFGGPSEGLAISAVDLNSDGKVDLLAGYSALDRGARFYTGRFVQVLINNGDGTFRDETSTRLPGQTTDNTLDWPYAIRVADLNGDGKPDLAVSLSLEVANALPAVYVNRGDGTFVQLSFPAPPSPMLDVADVNGDGRPDLVSAFDSSAGLHLSASLQKTAAQPRPKRKPKKKRHHP